MPWKHSRCLVWDVTCPDTLAPSHLNRAVTVPGVVATDAESRKHTKYENISRTHCFVPIAVETLGALGEEATAFLKDCVVRDEIKMFKQKKRLGWTHRCSDKRTSSRRVLVAANQCCHPARQCSMCTWYHTGLQPQLGWYLLHCLV